MYINYSRERKKKLKKRQEEYERIVKEKKELKAKIKNSLTVDIYYSLEEIIKKIKKAKKQKDTGSIWYYNSKPYEIPNYDPQKDKKLRWWYKNLKISKTSNKYPLVWDYYKSQEDIFRKELKWGIRGVSVFVKCMFKHMFIYMYNNYKTNFEDLYVAGDISYVLIRKDIGSFGLKKVYKNFNLFDNDFFYKNSLKSYFKLSNNLKNNFDHVNIWNIKLSNLARIMHCKAIYKILSKEHK